MGLSSALSIANSGLANIDAQFSILSDNVANAQTPGYAAEVANPQALVAEGQGIGILTGPVTRNIDAALQTSVLQQNTLVSGSKTTQTALQAVDAVLGTPGSGTDIGSLLGSVQNSFTTLLSDPSNQTQQSAVVSAASTLAQSINALSNTYTAQRQAAQNDLGSAVTTLNTTLTTIGQLSHQIVSLKQNGLSTADLENQRDSQVQTLSGLLQVNTVEQPDGDMSVFTSSGLSLPTNGATGTLFAIQPASMGAAAYYPGGGLPGITLGGADITGQMIGGRIGADITLRDQTLPTDQAALDEFSNGLANRFAAQGLTLFTDPSGNMPASGGSPTQANYVGFSSEIQVNPAVTADPSLVRDGTNTVAADPNGATAFTPNSGGPAGFTDLITRVLNFSLGTDAQVGVAQSNLSTNGLGPSGTLSAPFSGAVGTLSDYATGLVSSQAQQSSTVTSNLTGQQALQSSLTSKFSSTSGVNMDSEMSHMLVLQNAYSVNAKIISSIQTMFNTLIQAVQ